MKVGLVSVVVLNWNGLEDTRKCIESVLESTYKNIEIILVDNNSDHNPKHVQEEYPSLTCIRNGANLGYAGGNNVGIRLAKERGAEYIWILNNDTVVEKDCLGILVKTLASDNRTGAVTHRIGYLSSSDVKKCWYSGGYLQKGLPGHHGDGIAMNEVEPPKLIDYLSGCSFLAKSSTLDELSGFDENFFCYSEDVDLSLRMVKAGYRLAYAHDAVVWHKVSASSRGSSNTKLYYKFRNIIYLHKKHHLSRLYTSGWIVKSLRYCLSLVFKHRRVDSSGAVFIALVHGLIGKYGKSSRY